MHGHRRAGLRGAVEHRRVGRGLDHRIELVGGQRLECLASGRRALVHRRDHLGHRARLRVRQLAHRAAHVEAVHALLVGQRAVGADGLDEVELGLRAGVAAHRGAQHGDVVGRVQLAHARALLAAVEGLAQPRQLLAVELLRHGVEEGRLLVAVQTTGDPARVAHFASQVAQLVVGHLLHHRVGIGLGQAAHDVLHRLHVVGANRVEQARLHAVTDVRQRLVDVVLVRCWCGCRCRRHGLGARLRCRDGGRGRRRARSRCGGRARSRRRSRSGGRSRRGRRCGGRRRGRSRGWGWRRRRGRRWRRASGRHMDLVANENRVGVPGADRAAVEVDAVAHARGVELRVRLQQLVQTHVVAAGDGAQGVTLAHLVLLLIARCGRGDGDVAALGLDLARALGT